MSRFKIYILIIVYWLVVMNVIGYFALINVIGFTELSGIDINTLNNPLAEYWVSPIQLLESTLFGLFFGLLFVSVNELSIKFNVERLSFSYVILIKSGLYLVGFAFSVYFVFLITSTLGTLPEGALQKAAESQISIQLIAMALIFLLVQAIMLNFIMQTVTKFGYKNISNFLLGRYNNPVIEERIFLFMDLKSSTTYAEQLGNIKYSKLIKDCVNDINQLVNKFNAEIYQYVGDEVVLTWECKRQWNVLEGIEIFYAFKNKLEKRSDHYLSRYGVIPEFKAGLHGGKVTVAEIGNIKRDIAYHGDVLNTASRIESICNQYKEKLLISGWLLEKATELNGYVTTAIGDVQLKGKLKKIDVHAVRERAA